MSKYLKWYDSYLDHTPTEDLAKNELESAHRKIKQLTELLAKANERVAELEMWWQPDMFWNSDGDMSFDSLEELFDYYGDCHEGGELVMDCRIGVSLPDKTYRGVYDAENKEWVITEQLRKE